MILFESLSLWCKLLSGYMLLLPMTLYRCNTNFLYQFCLFHLIHKVLLEWIQIKYDMVTLFVKNNIQKTRTQNTQWKQRYRWKLNCSMTWWNGRHFPPASGRMTQNSVCLWSNRKHGDSNKRWRQRQFEPWQETGVRKMIMAMCCRNLFHYDLRVCMELQVLSKTASCLCFYTYKKYKNGNSARRTYLQRHIQPSITQNGSDNFSFGTSRKLPKIATSNVIFSRKIDRIAAKFCMTI